MRFLVLGGAGFLGMNFLEYCLPLKQHEITVLDHVKRSTAEQRAALKENLNQIQFIQGSILDEAILAKAIPEADVIFHFAAETSHIKSLTDPLQDCSTNILGTIKILEMVRTLNPEAFVIYTSSSTVLGKSLNAPQDSVPAPLEIHSANKLAGEHYFSIYRQVYGIRSCIVRFPNLYGFYGNPSASSGFINHFISQAVSHLPLFIYGTGEQKRNLLYSQDACQLLLTIAENQWNFSHPVCAGSSFSYSVKEIATAIIKTFQKGSLQYIDWPKMRHSIEIDHVEFFPNDFEYHGWKSQTSLEEGLEFIKNKIQNSSFLPSHGA